MLADKGEAYVRVTGVSMWPTLRHMRDGVIIVPPERVRAGDIVLYDRRNGRYALHRVIRTGERTFSMAGDHQWHLERDLPMEQIVGVAASIVRDGRRISCRGAFARLWARTAALLIYPRLWARKLIGPRQGKEHADED